MKTTFAFFALFSGAAAVCPNACSGHGACGRYDECTCYPGFTGYNCASKTCAFSIAWSDSAGHGYAECGNRGECNRDTGLCECYDGFDGSGCARLACLEGCSGHGTCETMLEMNSGYTGWDAEKIMHCNCDPGYTGADCASRLCMLGDDVMSVQNKANPSIAQVDEVQTIKIDSVDGSAFASGQVVLRFTDWRNEEWTTYPLDLSEDLTAIAVEEALEALPNHAIPSVTVTRDATEYGNNHLHFLVTFSSPANSGDQPAMTIDNAGCDVDGCQPRFIAATNAAVAITETTKGTKERKVCSGRGECDSEAGVCECYDGYHGQACEGQTIVF